MMKIRLIKSQILDTGPISFRKHEMEMWSIFETKKSRNQNPRSQETKHQTTRKLFYFQVRESPAPLSIPTLAPAPDQGGPVACLGCPVPVLDV